ncbi:MAG: DNA-processing protein DprA [Halanaerobiaceae bacterium]
MTEERKYWLGFSLIPGLGIVSINSLRDFFGNLKKAWRADKNQLKKAGKINLTPGKLINRRKKIDISQMTEQLKQEKINYLCFCDPEYPEILKKIDNPPPVLFVQGNYDFSKPAVAIVGSRRCTAYGRKVARKFACRLVQRNIAVISGLARGIDTCGHRGALEGNGVTVAVLGTGVDRVYPAENRDIYDEIQKKGLIVSEFPPGTEPRAENFPRRNRIISGLAQATLVVEAAEQSGSLITARLAREQGRKVFAVPGNLDRPSSSGCNNLIKNGALAVTCVDDILKETFLSVKKNRQPDDLQQGKQQEKQNNSENQYLNLEPREEKIIRKLQQHGELHFNEISEICDLEVTKLNSILLKLELKGLISSEPGKKYAFKGLQNLLKPI